jgi:ankyrin repeat protein
MSANKKKGNKPGKDNVEKFAPPPTENLILDNNILFEYSVSNDYQTICGAIDAGNHPISAYVIEQGLLKKRNEYGKTAFDLAASLGNKEFIRTLIERMGERPDDIASPFNLKQMIKQSNSYNFLHHACIWGRLDLCKLLIENSKLVTDPSVDENEFSSRSIDTFRSNKTTNPTTSLNQKPLGSVLLKSRCKTGETPLQLARRYNHLELIEYLVLAEKLQTFLDVLSDIKQFANDPEKNMNKLTKDDKVNLKIYLKKNV